MKEKPATLPKKKLKNNYLFSKNRFKLMEKEKRKWLKNLSLEKAEELQKSLLLFFDHHGSEFIKDTPVSYELLLKAKR
ncbi:MAG: hypothetical protein ABII74_03010 [Elusimicrobiota bacterium]